jgi:hypothetical protein
MPCRGKIHKPILAIFRQHFGGMEASKAVLAQRFGCFPAGAQCSQTQGIAVFARLYCRIEVCGQAFVSRLPA